MAAGGAWDDAYDLVVLGSGAAGLTTALVAALEGLRPLLVERAATVGGTTARSSGTVWIPDNPPLRRLGVTADREAARTYLEALAGARGTADDAALREAFLDAGPRMVDDLERRAGLHFGVYRTAVDYRQDMPGAAQGGRPLEPPPFDGRLLGPDFERLAAPLPELTLLGGMMVTRAEAALLLKAPWSWGADVLGARLVARHAIDRLRGHARGTRLVLGNALAARLFHGLRLRSVPVWLEARTSELLLEQSSGVTGLVVEHAGRTLRVRARRGVVLAGGGFPAAAEWRARWLPRPVAEHTPACPTCTGETIALGLAAGGALGAPSIDNALWFPSSIATRDDGSTAVYPHIVLDRAKPGLVAVGADGRRFVDEAVSYHEFVRAMYRAHDRVPTIPAWLVCDRRFVWKYGLGMILPHAPSLARHIRRGYLHCAPTPQALAARIGVDPTGLAETVRRHNDFARRGIDDDFGKGGNAYDRGNGDPAHHPNPCVGPIERAPFCAVAVVPTPLGTSLGLRTTPDAQVRGADGAPIGGLYACGNDMHGFVAGEYPGAGAQLGPAMTFGWLAARHAARRSAE